MLRPVLLVLVAIIVLGGAAGGYFWLQGQPTETEPAAVAAPELEPAAPAAAATPALAAQPGTQAAPSITEQHGSWTLNCVENAGTRQCALGQGLFASETGQRVLSLEVIPGGTQGTLRGTLMAPFSLSFPAGASLSVDGQPLATPLRFATCLQQGCVVPVEFDAAAVAALDAGTTLTFNATTFRARPVELPMSLDGFRAGTQRVRELGR